MNIYEFNLGYDRFRAEQNFKDRHTISSWCHEYIGSRREDWWLVNILEIHIDDKSKAMWFMLVWY